MTCDRCEDERWMEVSGQYFCRLCSKHLTLWFDVRLISIDDMMIIDSFYNFYCRFCEVEDLWRGHTCRAIVLSETSCGLLCGIFSSGCQPRNDSNLEAAEGRRDASWMSGYAIVTSTHTHAVATKNSHICRAIWKVKITRRRWSGTLASLAILDI